MHEYARHFVASAAAQILPCRKNSTRTAMARQLLPYCLSPVRDGFILLNREYKPLGWPPRRSGWVNYYDSMFSSMVVDLDPAIVERMHHVATQDGDFYYLYGGPLGAAPWTSAQAAREYMDQLNAVFGIRTASREGAAP